MCGVWRVSGEWWCGQQTAARRVESKALGGGNLSERGRRARSASEPVELLGRSQTQRVCKR